jgi:hypothetical protein
MMRTGRLRWIQRLNNVLCTCPVLYFSKQKGCDSETRALCQLELHYFGHIKDSFFVLEFKVCRHYWTGQNPTQPSSVLQSQLYVMNGAHFCVEIFLLHCPRMRYLSNCFQNSIIHNQSVGLISWLCGYYLLSENHLNSKAAIWDSSYYLDQSWNPPSLLFSGHQRPFLGEKRPGHDVNHSPPYTAEVENKWSNTSTPPVCLHGLNRYNSILNFLCLREI